MTSLIRVYIIVYHTSHLGHCLSKQWSTVNLLFRSALCIDLTSLPTWSGMSLDQHSLSWVDIHHRTCIQARDQCRTLTVWCTVLKKKVYASVSMFVTLRTSVCERESEHVCGVNWDRAMCCFSFLSLHSRCPAWCDRITMNESGLNVVKKVSFEGRQSYKRSRKRKGRGRRMKWIGKVLRIHKRMITPFIRYQLYSVLLDGSLSTIHWLP